MHINSLPPEIMVSILKHLPVIDRIEACLTCKFWYNCSLDPSLTKDIKVRLKTKGTENQLVNYPLFRRRLTSLDLAMWDDAAVSEKTLVNLLSKCDALEELNLSSCSSLFLYGRLFQNESERETLRATLRNLVTLQLGQIKHLTDVTFLDLVYVMPNLERISLASSKIIFGSKINHLSSSTLNFHVVIQYVSSRGKGFKGLDLSFTNVNDSSLDALGSDPNVNLEEIALNGVQNISVKGLMSFIKKQSSLKSLNINSNRCEGSGFDLFPVIAQSLSSLRTLNSKRSLGLKNFQFKFLSGLKYLKHVDFSETSDIKGEDFICGLCTSTRSLLSINLAFCTDVTDKIVESICIYNKNLEVLDLNSCKRITDASLLSITKYLSELKSLDVSHCQNISDLGVLGYIPDGYTPIAHSFDFEHHNCPCMGPRESKIFRKPTGAIGRFRNVLEDLKEKLSHGSYFSMLSNLTRLEHLNLASCPLVTDIGLKNGLKLPKLRSLNLNRVPKVSDACVSFIIKLHPDLEELSLTHNSNLSSTSIECLASNCRRLTSLDLTQCENINDSVLYTLTSRCSRLARLDISFCANIQEATAIKVSKSFPKLRILFRPYHYFMYF